MPASSGSQHHSMTGPPDQLCSTRLEHPKRLPTTPIPTRSPSPTYLTHPVRTQTQAHPTTSQFPQATLSRIAFCPCAPLLPIREHNCNTPCANSHPITALPPTDVNHIMIAEIAWDFASPCVNSPRATAGSAQSRAIRTLIGRRQPPRCKHIDATEDDKHTCLELLCTHIAIGEVFRSSTAQKPTNSPLVIYVRTDSRVCISPSGEETCFRPPGIGNLSTLC